MKKSDTLGRNVDAYFEMLDRNDAIETLEENGILNPTPGQIEKAIKMLQDDTFNIETFLEER